MKTFTASPLRALIVMSVWAVITLDGCKPKPVVATPPAATADTNFDPKHPDKSLFPKCPAGYADMGAVDLHDKPNLHSTEYIYLLVNENSDPSSGLRAWVVCKLIKVQP